jgi:hypothetical protein
MSDEAPGFQSIGTLTPRIAHSLKNAVSTPMPLPSILPTTGTPRPGPERLSSTGTLPSASGAATSRSISVSVEVNDDPAMTDKTLLAGLPPSVAHSLTSVNRIIDGPFGFDTRLAGYKLGHAVDPEELSLARAMVLAALEPVPMKVLAMELAHLRAVTARRATSESDEALGFSVFREELAGFPCDVIRGVLRGLARTSKFFPSLAEVYQGCEAAVRPRRLLADALNGAR